MWIATADAYGWVVGTFTQSVQYDGDVVIRPIWSADGC